MTANTSIETLIATLLADNASGDISAEDARDIFDALNIDTTRDSEVTSVQLADNLDTGTYLSNKFVRGYQAYGGAHGSAPGGTNPFPTSSNTFTLLDVAPYGVTGKRIQIAVEHVVPATMALYRSHDGVSFSPWVNLTTDEALDLSAVEADILQLQSDVAAIQPIRTSALELNSTTVSSEALNAYQTVGDWSLVSGHSSGVSVGVSDSTDSLVTFDQADWSMAKLSGVLNFVVSGANDLVDEQYTVSIDIRDQSGNILGFITTPLLRLTGSATATLDAVIDGTWLPINGSTRYMKIRAQISGTSGVWTMGITSRLAIVGY